MKKWKSIILESCMLLAVVFLIGTGIPASAKAKPKLSSKKITITVGQKKKLKVKNFKKKKKIKWSSKNKAIATVNKKGKIVGKKKGKTTIIAKIGKKKLKCKVTVKKVKKNDDSNKKNNTKISKNVKKQLPSAKQYRVFKGPNAVGLNKTVDLFDYVYYAGSPINKLTNEARVQGYKWVSSDTSVISIDKYGIATPKKVGKSTIYVKYLDKSGEWRETNTRKIEVINAGDVQFSMSYGLNEEWAKDAIQYYYDIDGNIPKKFNYITVTVRNNSDRDIVLEDNIAVYCIGWRYFETENKQSITVPKNSTINVLYKAAYDYDFFEQKRYRNFILDYNQTRVISPRYIFGGEQISQYYNIERNIWSYNSLIL